MSTTDTQDAAQSFAGAFDQIKDTSEQFFAAYRKAGNIYLDTYEKAVDSTIDLELKIAAATKLEWYRTAVETQADIARQLTSSYASTVRSMLK